MSTVEKRLFDKECLWNPYADSRILYAKGDPNIKHLMVGIDIESEELVLAERLKKKRHKIDAIMMHHPDGRALWDIDAVMPVQVDILKNIGVPENKADGLLGPRREQIYRRLHSKNLLRLEQAAELLGTTIFSVHNPADHLAAKFIYDHVLNKEYDSLNDIVKALNKIPEYEYYTKKGNPPIIAKGSGSSRPGKTVVFGFNGGTNGPSAFIEELSNAGVGTFLSMHISEEDRKTAAKHHINVIQCSHMASDTLGMNLILDGLLKKDKKLKILPVSGFIRVER